MGATLSALGQLYFSLHIIYKKELPSDCVRKTSLLAAQAHLSVQVTVERTEECKSVTAVRSPLFLFVTIIETDKTHFVQVTIHSSSEDIYSSCDVFIPSEYLLRMEVI